MNLPPKTLHRSTTSYKSLHQWKQCRVKQKKHRQKPYHTKLMLRKTYTFCTNWSLVHKTVELRSLPSSPPITTSCTVDPSHGLTNLQIAHELTVTVASNKAEGDWNLVKRNNTSNPNPHLHQDFARTTTGPRMPCTERTLNLRERVAQTHAWKQQ